MSNKPKPKAKHLRVQLVGDANWSYVEFDVSNVRMLREGRVQTEDGESVPVVGMFTHDGNECAFFGECDKLLPFFITTETLQPKLKLPTTPPPPESKEIILK